MPRRVEPLSPHHLAVPQNIDFEQLLRAHPPEARSAGDGLSSPRFKIDVCAALLDLMYTLWDWQRRKKHGKRFRGLGPHGVRLKAEFLEKNVHHDVYRYLDWLRMAGVIERVANYRAGHRAYTYALTAPYRDQRIRLHLCKDGPLRKRLLGLRWREVASGLRTPKDNHVEPAPQYSAAVSIHPEIIRAACDALGLRPVAHEYLSVGEVVRHIRWNTVESPVPSEGSSLCSGITRWELQDSEWLIGSDQAEGAVRCANNVRHYCTEDRAVEVLDRLRADLSSVRLRSGWRSLIQRRFEAGRLSAARANYAEQAAQRIEDGHFRLWRDSTAGRLHSNVTALPRYLRPFLTLRGASDLMMLDIRASQPYLLTGLLRWLSRIEPAERTLAAAADEWASFVSDSTDPYRAIASVVYGREPGSFTDAEREEAKKSTMCLLFSHPKQKHDFKEPFRRAFPHMDEFIRRLKRFGYEQCAVILQRYEAEIMIGAVAERLTMAGVPLLTVHDCVIVRSADEEPARNGLTEAFGRVIGTAPVLKVEALRA